MAGILIDSGAVAKTRADESALDDILVALRQSGRLHRGEIETVYRTIIETCARALHARTVTIREYNRDRSRLIGRDQFIVADGSHAAGADVPADDGPELFVDPAGIRVFETRAGGERSATMMPTTQLLRSFDRNDEALLDLHALIWVGGRAFALLSVESPGAGRCWRHDERQFVATLADLTANAIEHWQRRRAQIALAECEDRFQVLAESSGAAIFSFAERIDFANEALARLLGRRRDELPGLRLADLVPVEAHAALEAFRAARELGATQPVEQELVLIARDGSRLWLHVSAGVTLHQGEAVTLATAFDITERKRTEAELHNRAYRDPLTGLPNRALFLQRLERLLPGVAPAGANAGAVILFDIDQFKIVNNALGRDLGDQLLIEIARRLEKIMREHDTVGRLEGDTFALLLPGGTERRGLERIARRIGRSITRTVLLGEHPVNVTASLGIVADTSAYRSADAVLSDAEIALQKARTIGRGAFALFEAAMHSGTRKMVALSAEMRLAIDRAEFRLALQPIVALGSGTLFGFEALLRWRRASGEDIAPQEFIPLAEDNGLIVPIGDWVLGEACALLSRWRREYPERLVSLSVNVSGRQLRTPGFVRAMRGHLRVRGVEPALLKLELTETILLDNTAAALAILQRLKRLGVGLSLDDFGTGYSSLGYLHRFPFDILKIDRSFVEPLCEATPSAGIVDAILALGRTLRMQIVAEGIETEAQLQRLTAMGCTYGQGYFLSRPLELDAAETLLRQVAPAKENS